MRRRSFLLNILLLQAILFLVWLTIHRFYSSSSERDLEEETNSLSKTMETRDGRQVKQEQETVYMFDEGNSGDITSGRSGHSGKSMPEESESLAKLPHDDGQVKDWTIGNDVDKLSSLLTAKNKSNIERKQTANYSGSRSVAKWTDYAESNHQKSRKNKPITEHSNSYDSDPDKVFSTYMRSFNESMMCKELKTHKKHTLELGPDTKLILYWQEDYNYAKRRGGFPEICSFPTDGPCEITWDNSYRTRADAIVFHASRLYSEKLPFKKLPGQVWIARALESPAHWHKVYRSQAWKGVFNWTFTYRPDSELFSPVGSITRLPEREDKPDYRQITMKKTRSVAWFVSDCRTHSQREKYVKEMKKYIDIDIYGECGNLVCSKDEKGECFDLLSRKYRFYLAFENSLCNYYITEKFFNKFGSLKTPHHVIPVVRGGTDYRKYFPEGTFIDAADFKSPKALALYLDKFRTDPDAYATLIERKDMFGSVPCTRNVPWCKLCNMLHDKNIKPKLYKDIGAWWDQEACVEPKDI